MVENFNPETYHRARWRLLAVWACLLSLIVIVSLGNLRRSSATVHELQHTNCKLKLFLLTARHTRLVAAKNETGKRKQDDLKAAYGYLVLADPFRDGAVGHCAIPDSLFRN